MRRCGRTRRPRDHTVFPGERGHLPLHQSACRSPPGTPPQQPLPRPPSLPARRRAPGHATGHRLSAHHVVLPAAAMAQLNLQFLTSSCSMYSHHRETAPAPSPPPSLPDQLPRQFHVLVFSFIAPSMLHQLGDVICCVRAPQVVDMISTACAAACSQRARPAC